MKQVLSVLIWTAKLLLLAVGIIGLILSAMFINGAEETFHKFMGLLFWASSLGLVVVISKRM
jgi:hypothetical protein